MQPGVSELTGIPVSKQTGHGKDQRRFILKNYFLKKEQEPYRSSKMLSKMNSSWEEISPKKKHWRCMGTPRRDGCIPPLLTALLPPGSAQTGAESSGESISEMF